MKFLCDEMLAGLARWLRAAGYDVAQGPPGAQDRALLAQSEAEGRVFITRDRAAPQIRTGATIWVLAGAALEAQAAELKRRGVDWRLAPFTRCVMDNTPLEPAAPEDMARMPEASRTLPGPHRVCPRCGRVFWPGSHVRRMAARLEAWASESSATEDG